MSEEQSYQELYDKGFDEGFVDEPSSEEEEVVEEEEETVEQPEEEEESESEESPDEEEEADTEESNEEDSIEKQEEEEPKYSIKLGGNDIELTVEELKILAQKGGDYTRKTQDLAKHRQLVELATEKGISVEDLAVLADIKDGKKEALARLSKQAGIDPLDVDGEGDYSPVVEEKNYALKDVIEEIKSNPENSIKVDRYLSAMPDTIKEQLVRSPDVLRGLSVDSMNGVADKIMPDVIKQMMINPHIDFKETYQAVGQKVFAQEQTKVSEKKEEAPRETKQKASITKRSTKKVLDDHKDVWEDQELFEKMNKMLDPQFRI